MRVADLSIKFYKELSNYKTISKMIIHRDEMQKWCNTIDAINALPRHSMSYQHEALSHWKMPTVFENVIYPDSVTVSGDSKEIDFLNRPKVDPDAEVMTLSEFNDFNVKVYSLFKKSEQTKDIAGLRTGASIASVLSRTIKTIDGKQLLPITAAGVFPIELNDTFIKEDYYGNSAEIVLNDWFRSVLSALR